jgi:hypothetical protein
MTIHLDEQSSALLRSIASSQNRSEAEVVRALLADYVSQSAASPGPRATAKPRIRNVGKYSSGTSDTSSRAEEILEQAVKDGEWP